MAKKSDGQAVQVTTTAARTKGDFVVESGYFGEVMNDAANGDQATIDIAQTEKMVDIADAGVGVTLGAFLFFNGTTWANASASGYYRVGKVSRVRDANGLVYFVQQPQAPAA